jgi:hypothetical protein
MKFEDQSDYNEESSFNIDIEFSSVEYLDIPNIFNGLTITELTERIPSKFDHYKNNLNFRVFEIKSNQNLFYIVAGSYVIGKNRWISEDRVSNMSLEYDEIIATS